MIGLSGTSDPIGIAQFIADSIKVIKDATSFSVVFYNSGYHLAYGMLYADKSYGIFNIEKLGGTIIRVSLTNGEYKIIGA